MKEIARPASGIPHPALLGRHAVARPLPEPPRYRHVSRVGMPATDRVGQQLEEWMGEIRSGYTEAGD